MDELDRRILLEYLRDARQSSREIARKVGVSTGTVLARTRRMEEEGVIRGYSAIIDHAKLGYQLTAVTEVTVSKGRLLEVDREIAGMPCVCAVYDVTGEIDAVIIAKFRSVAELSSFTKRLLANPYVERTNTHVVLNVIKEDFRMV